MTLPSLDGVRAKLARADSHIHDLDEILNPLAERATKSIVREPHGEPGNHWLFYRVTEVPEYDPSWSTIVGDALFNLRSALDHLANRLVELDGGIPCDRTQFPIYPSRTNDKGNPRNVTIQPGIGRKDIRDALDQIQPYQEVEKYGHDLNDDALWLTRELCNIDKHRLLLTVVHRLDLDAPNLPWWEGEGVVGYQFTSKPLESNDLVGKFAFGETPPRPNFNPHVSLAITLDEPGWSSERSVPEFLGGLRHNLTAELNRWFVSLFPGERPLDVGSAF
jgi:hypothetical protein